MEQQFVAAWMASREKAMKIGVRLRPLAEADAIKKAHRYLSGHRESDGFQILADKGRLDLSLEALAISKKYTELFNDDEANNALSRLLAAGYRFG